WQSASFAQPEPPPSTPTAPPPPPPTSAPKGNGRGSGNGFDHSHGSKRGIGSKTEAEHDIKYAEEHANKPFDDVDLRAVGYSLKHVFDFTLPDRTLLYQQNRYELPDGAKPTEKRPRKRFRPHRRVNGIEVTGAGNRHVIYNWPAIMRAGPGSTVV